MIRAQAKLAILAALATETMHCGPTAKQEGELILLVLPVVTLAAMGVQWPILRAWRHERPLLELDWRKNLVWLVTLALPAIWVLITDWNVPEKLTALLWFGSSYLALTLLFTRIWLFSSGARQTFFLSHLVIGGFYSVTTLPYLLELEPRPSINTAEILWLAPGIWGIPTGVLLLGLIVERLVRSRRAR